jgi:hypothetical protein
MLNLLFTMRILFCLVLIPFVFLSTMVTAQESGVRRCATTDYWNAKLAADPALRQRFEQENAELQRMAERNASSRQTNMVYTIPVVVHVVWRTSAQNISDQQIQSQIEALNEDFARLNADTGNTPSGFRGVAAATAFRFCLAQTDTNGNPTNGIERRNTTFSSFSTNDNVKRYSTGGLDPWDPSRYLNIWVCNMSGGVLGYGEFPTAAVSLTYGLVIQYNAFGRVGTLQPSYNLGRTTVHEICHCFRLSHIWGDDNGTCTGTDFCSDTPNQGSENYGCPTFPLYDNCTSTGNGVQFMNYMDYCDDICLNMFTNQQSLRMVNAMSSYKPTLLTSTACQSPNTGISDLDRSFSFSVYPNPSNGIFDIDLFLVPAIVGDLKMTVTDQLGRVVKNDFLVQPAGRVIRLDLSAESDGVYFLKLSNSQVDRTVRVVLAR